SIHPSNNIYYSSCGFLLPRSTLLYNIVHLSPICCTPIFFTLILRKPTSTLFPYTTLFRSRHTVRDRRDVINAAQCRYHRACQRRDRKSTRLNSSHVSISYAVFCLKKNS